LAVTADWRTTLVGLALMPFMVISQLWYANRKAGFSEKTDIAYRESTNMINDTACNIRTIGSFGDPSLMIRNFNKILDTNIKLIPSQAFKSGVSMACSNFTLFGK